MTPQPRYRAFVARINPNLYRLDQVAAASPLDVIAVRATPRQPLFITVDAARWALDHKGRAMGKQAADFRGLVFDTAATTERERAEPVFTIAI